MDKVCHSDGIAIIVAPKDLMNLRGVVIDYRDTPIGEGFVFAEPKKK